MRTTDEGRHLAPLEDRPRGELLLDLLLGALRVGDGRLNALAVELLSRCGVEGPLRRLVQEAADRQNCPAHRVRVLRAIRRIGRVADLASYLDLLVLAQDESPDVRSAAARLLGDLGHPQADLAEEPGLAMLPVAGPLPVGKRRRALPSAGATPRAAGP